MFLFLKLSVHYSDSSPAKILKYAAEMSTTNS